MNDCYHQGEWLSSVRWERGLYARYARVPTARAPRQVSART